MLVAAGADAALLPRHLTGVAGTTNAYYDTAINITWLRDANYAQTSGFAAGGLMTFATAQSWAAALTLGGVSGWSLADVAQPDAACASQDVTYGSTGAGCTGGQLGHMFYTLLGGTAGTNITTSHGANFALFDNVSDAEYWSMTSLPLSADPRDLGYFLTFGNAPDTTPAGWVSLNFKTVPMLGWVVHAGDVGEALDIPEPTSPLVLALGGVALGLARRPRSRVSSPAG